jgi:hypothetical protein
MQVFSLCAFLILAVFPNFAFAEELQVDRVYASGTTVSSKLLGISLKVPKGYEGSVGGEFFVLSRGEEAMVEKIEPTSRTKDRTDVAHNDEDGSRNSL